MELLFADVCGPFSKGYDGSAYLFGVVDDFSDFVLARTLRSRESDVLVTAMGSILDEITRVQMAAGVARHRARKYGLRVTLRVRR